MFSPWLRSVLILGLLLPAAAGVVAHPEKTTPPGLCKEGKPCSDNRPSSPGEPLAEDAVRVTYLNDGRPPKVEGVSINPSTGRWFWSGTEDWTATYCETEKPGQSCAQPSDKDLEEFIKKYFEADDETAKVKPVKEELVRVLSLKKDPPEPKTRNAPLTGHCHKTVYINGVPYLVHC